MLGNKSQNPIAEGPNVSATETLTELWITYNNAEIIISRKHRGYEVQHPEFDNSIPTNVSGSVTSIKN
jgi:hypothetical protein